MLNLISESHDGAIWVKTSTGEVFGVVTAFEILDEDGAQIHDKSAEEVLGEFTSIVDNWEMEAQIIELDSGNGNQRELVMDAHGAEINEF